MRTYLPLVLCISFFSCAPQQERESPSQQLIGEWRNTYMKVEMQTYNNTDSTSILEVNEHNWESILKIRTIQTFYNADGTYNSKHTDLKDSVVYNPAGRWSVQGDTLIMTDTFPRKGLTYKYRFAIKENETMAPATRQVDRVKEFIAEFWGMEDFDQDGKEDDRYYGIQRKQLNR